jgi:hypothetical protein
MMSDQVKLDLLDFDSHSKIFSVHCAFNLNGEIISCGCIYDDNWDNFKYVTCIYSIQTINNKLMYKCKRMYLVPRTFISVSSCDKLYLLSNNSVHEFNLNTEKNMKIFGNDEIIMTVDDFIKVM